MPMSMIMGGGGDAMIGTGGSVLALASPETPKASGGGSSKLQRFKFVPR